MKKNIKKLPLMLFALGSAITPILLTTVLSNNFYLTSNENVKLDSINKKNIPNLKSDFTKAMADQLIADKIADNASWDGSLIASDFHSGIRSIGTNAFINNTEVKSIILPNTVTSIDDNAFTGANNLTSISAPGLTYIHSSTFLGCSNLTTINLISATNIFAGSFQNMNELSSVSLPHAEIIGDDVFAGTSNLINISLPAATTIGSNVFSGSGLTTINLPAATSIARNAFISANAIRTGGIKLTKNENIDDTQAQVWGVSDTNKLNIINDTKKFTKAMANKLINEKIAADPNWDGSLIDSDFLGGITSIGTNAFINSSEVKSITLPNTVKTINQNAFEGCSALTTITALGVTNIGLDAFKDLPNIEDNGIELTYSANISSIRQGGWGITNWKINFIGAPPDYYLINFNNIVIGVTVGVGGSLLIAAGIGGFLYYRKKKSNQINIEPQSDLEEILD